MNDRTPQERLHDAFCNLLSTHPDEVLLLMLSVLLIGKGFEDVWLRHHTDIWNLPDDAAQSVLEYIPSLNTKRPSPALVLQLI